MTISIMRKLLLVTFVLSLSAQAQPDSERADTSTLTVSQRDLDVRKQKEEDQKKAKELLKEARKLWKEGKLQQAIDKVAQAQKLSEKDKEITKTLKAMQNQKKQLDDKLTEASGLINQGKLDGAKKVLDRAARINDKYEKYKEVLKQLTDAKLDNELLKKLDLVKKEAQERERSEFAMKDEEAMIPPELVIDEMVDREYTVKTTTRGLNRQVTMGSTSRSVKKHSQVFYEKGNHTIVDILYGTDRKIDDKKDWENYYTAERGKLKYGVAQVSIPKIHEFGKMERPAKFWLFELKEKIGEHVIVTKLENIHKEDFHKFLKNKLNNVEEKDILIFIHGFNVSFASAIRRTAQIAYDLNFTGVPMAYSWPSLGEKTAYMYDGESVKIAVPHLEAFLKTVIDKRGDANIHIIAHSMGTRLLTNALKEISSSYKGKHVFKNVILAAPDIDNVVFRTTLFPHVRKTVDHITLYASSDDKALQASGKLHKGTRVGQSGDNIFVFKGLDTIDASGIDTSFLGHSYFAEKEILVKDLKDVIRESKPPSQRDSLIEKIKEKVAYWKFILDNL